MANETTIQKRPEEALKQTERTRNRPHFNPYVDILELEDEMLIKADMPGMRTEDVDINFEKGTLTIHGKVNDRQHDGVNYMLQEYEVGDFHRSFEVSEAIDAEKIAAEYVNGVLTLRLPKTEAVKPRKIAVKAK
jgi:HSP20 family protein